jgi:CRISPR-associated protein (TIGR03984 family)
MPSNPLQLIKLKDQKPLLHSGNWEGIEEQLHEHFKGKKATTLVMMHHCVCLGSFEDGKLLMPDSQPFQPEYLRSLRVFDQDRECYVWKSSMDDEGLFRLRIRLDEEEENGGLEAVEARQLLWGTHLADGDDKGWKVLTEKRGIELRIHSSLIPENAHIDERNRLWLVTRNYIDYTPVGQAGYVDCRFVRIEYGRGE